MKKSIMYALIGGMAIITINSCDTLEDLCNIGEEDMATGELFVSSLTHLTGLYERIDIVRKDSLLIATGTATIDGANCTLSNDSLIIEFGETSVITADGKKRSGSIRAKVTGDYMNTSGSIDAYLHGFMVNEKPIEGNLLISNTGSASLPMFNVKAIDFMVNNETIVNYDLEFEWQNGFKSQDILDDVIDVSGSVIGGDSVSSKDFTANILSPLHLSGACNSYIEWGELRITLKDEELVPTMDIDFIASDSCNNLFKATVDCTGNPLSFTFPFE